MTISAASAEDLGAFGDPIDSGVASKSELTDWIVATALMFTLSLGGLALEHGVLIVGWPMNAVVLACLLRSRTALWPSLLVPFVLSCLVAPIAHGKPLPLAFAMDLGNAAEMLVGAAILRRWLGRGINLARIRDLWSFTLVAVLGLPLLSMIMFNFAGADHRILIGAVPRLGRWAVGNALGYMVVTPALLICTPKRLHKLAERIGWPRLALTVATYSAVVLVLSLDPTGDARILLAPALLWLTFQLGATGAAAGLFIQAAIITGYIRLGVGPMVEGRSATDALTHLQLGLVLNALCAYPVAAAITHRRRLAGSLAASNASLEQAQKIAQIAEQIGGVGHVRFDVATRQSVISENLARMLGRDVGERDGEVALKNAIHPEDVETQDALMAQAIATGIGYDTVLRVRGAAGDFRIFRTRSSCEIGPDGAVTGLMGVLVDVTDMQLADGALRASEARFRLLAEHSTDMILQTDLGGELTYVSPAVEDVLGFSTEEVIGLRPHELMDPGDAADADARRDAFSSDPAGTLGSFTYRTRHKDGRWLWLESRSSLMRDPQSREATGSMHLVRDVTARREMEETLQRKCREAEAATTAKSEFLANMSHEIRTPLSGIIGFSDLLLEMKTLPEVGTGYARRIHTAGVSLLSIVNDVLDFSKLDADQLELNPQPFEPARFVHETVELVAVQAEQKGLSLEVRFDGAIPDWVEADSLRLRQVLLNLLTNAIKFTNRGGVTVEAAYDDDADRFHFAVHDTGCGIPADRRDRLFERFSQIDSSISRVHGGTGLGLAISKHLAHLMGGAIEVESREGEGSVFRFAITAPKILAPHAVKLETWEEEAESRPLRLLVVDDVTANRELVRAMLSPFGHSFVEAENGLEAVEAARRELFDLILMDMRMPLMDGLAATRAIRAESANLHTPILALTANVLPADVAACRGAGMDDHVAKPINLVELLTKVVMWSEGGEIIEAAAHSADANVQTL